MKTAIYAGSFDPMTNGHLWMIKEGVKLFDRLIIAIAHNPDKKYMFSLDARLQMVAEASEHMTESCGNMYLVDYAKDKRANFILRGIRNQSDAEYERSMRHINDDLSRGYNITSVFLMPPRRLCEVSSSLVKGLIGPDGWETIVKEYVPPLVFDFIKAKHAN
jgi:pantetheine-phosphate adenylyltransferase